MSRKTIFLSPKIEALVVSAGGVGTTFLMKAISDYRQINCPDNTDGWKHLPIPPISERANLKVIYVFGDPILATISLFRRQYHATHAVAMQKYSPEQQLLSLEDSLSNYVDRQIDIFQFERHFDNWQKRYTYYPTLFIHYDHIHEELPVIAKFLDLPADFLQHFPAKQARKARLDDLAKKDRIGLEGMYGSFREKINQLPPYFIQSGQPERTTWNRLIHSDYRRAFYHAFLQRHPKTRKAIRLFQQTFTQPSNTGI